MSLSLVAYYVGGQKKKSHTFSVQAGDYVIALGSANDDRIGFALTGVSSVLLASVGQFINQTRVWLVQSSGNATCTQSGQGTNWDHIVAILRPQAAGEWEPRIWYTNQPSGAPRVVTPVESGTYVFIHRYAGSGARVNNPPQITGVSYQTVVDVLPEGDDDSGNSRETIIRATSSGQMTVVGPTTTEMMVAFLVPKAEPIFEDFLLV